MKTVFLICALALPPQNKIDEVKRLEEYAPYVMMTAGSPAVADLEEFINKARPGHEIMLIWDKTVHPQGWERVPLLWEGYSVFVRKMRRSA